MVNRYDDNGCWVGTNAHGPFVTYEDYRALEVKYDILLEGMKAALTELEYPATRLIAIDDAVCTATNLLMNALDKGE